MDTITAGLAIKGAEKVVETGAELLVQGIPVALSAIVKRIREKGKGVPFRDAFVRYLRNAANRYNQVRTLATGAKPRTIIGPENIYISIGVAQRKNVESAVPWYNNVPFVSCEGEFREISTVSVNCLLNAVHEPGRNYHVLVLGTGGAGKSMLMRYLFLTAIREGDYVPILLELRQVSKLGKRKASIIDLIYASMESFDVNLPREQFEETLQLGKYIFLLDGLDEVKEKQFPETVRAVQAFCAKYPKNPCIVTSRPRPDLVPPETFTVVESMPLDAKQAAELAGKLWPQDEKTVEFCRQLQDSLYDAHRSFAENPLLLSILFLTFMRNSSIPNHLAEFYGKAYEALYCIHDRNNKGYYQRDFKSGLTEDDFKLLFSRFCFQTYFREQYDFSREEIQRALKENIRKLGITRIDPESKTAKAPKPADYLFDLQEAVCLMVEDGRYFKFAHRTFQSYFAAWYTSRLPDKKQEELFQRILYDQTPTPDNVDYLEILCQIESERFAVNAMEKRLRKLLAEAEASANLDEYLLERWTGKRWYFINMNDLRNSDDLRESEGGLFRDTLFLQLFWLYIVKPDISGKQGNTQDYLADHRYRRLRNTNCVSDLRKALRKWLNELNQEQEGKTSEKFFDKF